MALLRNQAEKDNLLTFSTFTVVEKTLGDVVTKLMSNERLKRLLYYSDKHCLSLPRLNQEQSFSLLNEQIKVVPEIDTDDDVKPYVVVSMDYFVPMSNQTTFRKMRLQFDILCRYKEWLLDDFKLRPFSIAGEIDGMINNSMINHGLADFAGAKRIVLTKHLGGVQLYYILETFFNDTERQQIDKEKLGIVTGARRAPNDLWN